MRNKVIYSGVLGAVCLTAVSVSNTFAQITPQQIATVKSVTSAKISADGQFIAYTLSTPVDPKKDNLGNSSHLYVVNMSTGASTALYTANNVGQVEFKPNSSIITFVTKEKDEKTNAIYQVNAQGGDVKKIYQYSSNIAVYNWHNDGAQLAFISAERLNKPKTSLTYSPTFFEEEFPDRNAYIVNTTQSAAPQKINVTGSAYMIKWSPNGKKIALSVAPTSSVDDSYMAQSIKIVDAGTRNIIAHIDNKGKLGQFTWSPDGNTIAIVGAYDLNDPTDGTLLTVSAQGGTPKVIDGDFQGKYESISWTEDKDIYFLASEGVSSGIGRISVDGKNKMYHRKSDTQHFTTFSIAKTGQIAYTANSSTQPNELFTVHNRNRKAAMQLTNSNPWMKDLKFGRQEVVTYKARDGKYDIQGMLIYPLDYKEGTKYPLITVVHGGPESHYSNGWLTGYSMPGQMGATEGYAVFYPNYRGSTGRGVDFTYSSQSDLAGKEFDDIVDGVDYLINMGLVDPQRVGVTGGSYGGYASAWMSTYYSDRFAAAVMFVGISNNISKFGTSDIPTEMKLVHERGNIWDDWQKQLEISPIYHVDKAKTPILIMHGAEDPRVHPAQSMELYRHIKVRKPEVPVRLIYYPGEGHGNARSGSKYDYNLRMMQWFDVYLKSGNRKAAMPNLDLPE